MALGEVRPTLRKNSATSKISSQIFRELRGTSVLFSPLKIDFAITVLGDLRSLEKLDGEGLRHQGDARSVTRGYTFSRSGDRKSRALEIVRARKFASLASRSVRCPTPAVTKYIAAELPSPKRLPLTLPS